MAAPALRALGRADHAGGADRPVRGPARGTDRIGRSSARSCWSGSLSSRARASSHIVDHPAILRRCHRTTRRLSAAARGTAFIVLGAVVLCVTGAEALYADMGHFGKRPIRLAWFGVVLPALMLNYFGQGAMLLATRRRSTNPFSRWPPSGRSTR